MFAYSSIAHGGYLLIGVTVGLFQAHPSTPNSTISGIGSALFYVGVYTFATLGTFAVLATLGSDENPTDDGAETIDDLNGLAKSHRLAALSLAVFMFSLAGIPPLAGFWGKFNLLMGAIQSNQAPGADWETGNWFLILAVVGVLNAAIGAAYYLRVIARMYFFDAGRVIPNRGNPGPVFTGAICLVLTVASGFYSGPMLDKAQQASEHIVGHNSQNATDNKVKDVTRVDWP
jgi:NADH-quinone oxidoreductase subunit N